MVGKFFQHDSRAGEQSPPSILHEAFSALPLALQQICGSVTFLPDNGRNIINHISSTNNILLELVMHHLKMAGLHMHGSYLLEM